MTEMPANLPSTAAAAVERLYAVTAPSLDDFKLMVFLEAAGLNYYDSLVAIAPNEELKHAFARNGREEMGHAHRVVKVLKRLYDIDFPIPADAENPYAGQAYGQAGTLAVTKELLDSIIQGENGGGGLYERWASTVTDEEAARLLRQNGKEEGQHGKRIQDAMAFLPAA